jgi:hypothetical protein
VLPECSRSGQTPTGRRNQSSAEIWLRYPGPVIITPTGNVVSALEVPITGGCRDFFLEQRCAG